MDYRHDQLDALVGEVERQGGAQLPDECEPSPLKYKVGERVNVVNSCFCGNETVFVITYEPTAYTEKREARKRGGGFVKVCAVCDDVGRWPRFRKEVPA